MVNGWHYIKATNQTRVIAAWGGATQDYAIIVFVVDDSIVAAIDEREREHPKWEAVVDWDNGLVVPVSSDWRSVPFQTLQPLSSPSVRILSEGVPR